MAAVNPFYDVRAISSSKAFWGRRELIEDIFKSYINVPVPQCLSLIGDKGTGKTSILNYLTLPEVQKEYMDTSNTLLVHIDFANRILSNAADFYRIVQKLMYQEITRCRSIGDNIREEAREYFDMNKGEQDLFMLRENLADMFRMLKYENYKTMLLIDNFEKAFKETNLNCEELDFLRTLANSTIEFSVGYIIVSEKNLKTLSDDVLLSGFYNIFTHKVIKPFTEYEINEFTAAPFYENGINISENEKKWLFSVSGGQASILRAAAKILFDSRLENKEGYKSEADFSKAVCKECGNLFDSMWKHMEEEERQLYIGMVQGKTDKNSRFLDEARSKFVIRESDTEYEFMSAAFKDYVRENSAKIKPAPETVKTAEIVVKDEENPDPFERYIMLLGQGIGKYLNIGFQNIMDKIDDTSKETVRALRNDMYGEFQKFKAALPENGNDTVQVDKYTENVKNKVIGVLKDKNIENFPRIKNSPVYKIWDKLQKETRDYVLVGEILSEMFDSPELDQAPVSLCYCKGLETEVNNTILKQLKLRYPNSQVSRNSRSYNISELDTIMLGELNYVITRGNNSRNIGFYIKNKGINVTAFTDSLSKVGTVRNNSAHSASFVSKDMKEFVRDALLGGDKSTSMFEMLLKI